MGKPQREVDPFLDELRSLRQGLGRRIRELRQERGWSQEEFADRAHVHRTFAGSLERGEKNCSFHALILIARCFGISLSELLSGIEGGQPAAGQPGRRARSGEGNLDRSRILKEASALESAARTLREIALSGGQRRARKRT